MLRDSQGESHSFRQAAGLRDVAEGDPVPDAAHQQALKEDTLRKTGLDDQLATANPDVKNGVRWPPRTA